MQMGEVNGHKSGKFTLRRVLAGTSRAGDVDEVGRP